MKTVLLALVALLLADDAFGQRGDRRRRHEEPAKLEHFTYEKVSFEAPSLESESGEFGLYLPVGYEADAKEPYPWILWLHGMNEDADRFHDGGGAVALDRLRGEDKIPEVVVVAPSAPRRTIYANGEGAGDVEDYVLRDLMSYVEQHYRVAKDRRGRALMGVSMGGMGALRLALKYPERFATVAVHSAAAFPPDPTVLDERSAERVQRSVEWLGLGSMLGDPIDPEKWAQLIPSAMVKEMKPDDVCGLRIFFDAGTEDRYGFGPPNEAFHDLLKGRGIPHSFDLVEGGGHSWGSGSMPERLAASLTFVAKGLAAGDAPADGARGTNGTNGTGGADGEDAEDEGSPPEGSGDGEERPRDPARDGARRSL